ncbi:1-phosphatidylinositol phosphodiesterase-like isoform X1 [Cyprinus carpio]|uniref:1-phosphatidylinositol phosphodiesterase-like isoform X1 n=3 Tax=Cyprinus carpio TaxID=7962 RepID=A0A9R0BE61_CYPCA|nr:1-phosphatidylinositol phosphodiesterase-like isoform X1 [Cyprinus carpio]
MFGVQCSLTFMQHTLTLSLNMSNISITYSDAYQLQDERGKYSKKGPLKAIQRGERKIKLTFQGLTLYCTHNFKDVSSGIKDQWPLKRLIMESTRGRILQLMVMGILLGATVSGYRAIQTPDYDDTSTPEILNPSWMATIPDVYSLSDVTMPGTHNTMALYGGSLAECNSWSLALQLRAGIRFLDIRVRHAKGNLTIHHGISYQYAHFGDVLMDVVAFLREFPSETVLMRLKEELSNTQNIYGAVVRYINEYAHWDLLWHSHEMPSMGEARGKLIVLQDFTGPDLGIRYNSLDIADDWKVSSLQPGEVEKKWKSVSTHLEAAAVGNKNRMFLTYSSGASILAHPNSLARLINPRLHGYLTGYVGQRKRFGIVTMDFPGAKLVQTIIGFNY